ncbi:Peroxisomal membrane protein PEX16 [Phytophthora ramorum]|uniref:Peroxisomal membrane protein PEX16 n=1 Tax=Phytophthora ramorum TaxID=164328 RepID=H3GJR8_PHYRM|nr:Peroxisomal membrane protein PEX16 [Phytophthora ramorum]
MADEIKTTTVETDVMTDGDSKTTTTVTHTKTSSTGEVAPSTDASASAPTISKTASLLGAYESWVGSHTGLARNVETTLYVAPQLVPKRVMEPEVATQFGYSLVGLLHLYHDYVLYKKENDEKEPPTNSQKLTRLVRVPLSLISHVQVLAEVIARKVGGDAGKWRLIVWVEFVKGMLRLVLLAQRRRAMLLRGGKYKGVESVPRPSPFARFKKPKQPGARTGKTFGKATAAEPEPSTEKDVDEAPNKITFEDATVEIAEDARDDLLVAGEVCHILRPVVYALLRRRRPETSWTPVLVSLLVELSGLAFSAAAVKSVAPKNPSATDNTKEEIAARKMALLLYLLRDPVFAAVTKPAAGKAADVLDYVPGVGKLFRFGTTAVLDYYHQFHFYTSAS